MSSGLDSAAESLEERRARRARKQRSLWSGLLRLLRLLRRSWRLRRNEEARPLLRATVPVGAKLRFRLCLFSEPLLFLRHALTQRHPRAHQGMTFALELTLGAPAPVPFPAPGEWGRFLEASWAQIHDEWRRSRRSPIEHPNRLRLVEAGRWELIPLYKGGLLRAEFASRFPETLRVVEALPHCAEGLDGIGQIVFSVLQPGTQIRPHSGSTNLRLRYHLPLTSDPAAYLTVAGEQRSWETGRCLCFDDALEHAVHHDGVQPRVVLMVDLWRPELSSAQIELLRALLAEEAPRFKATL